MLVTLSYDLGTSGPEKDGVDRAFGKLTETAVNDFQEKKRTERDRLVIWEFSNTLEEIE